MLYLLNFFEEQPAQSPWLTYVILGVLFVGMILMMIIPQNKQRKRNEEMMSRLAVGSVITTIGGIIGQVVALDDKHIWISTGLDENKCVMQFVRQAIHSIDPAPGSAEAKAIAKAESEEVDEVK